MHAFNNTNHNNYYDYYYVVFVFLDWVSFCQNIMRSWSFVQEKMWIKSG